MYRAWTRAQAALQMEKRVERETGDCFQRCRLVLQRGLAQNPSSAQIMVTWGLTEVRSWRGLCLERCSAVYEEVSTSGV